MKLSKNFLAVIGLLSSISIALGLWISNENANPSAIDFIQRTYAGLYHDNSNSSSLDKADEIFSSSLFDLIRKEQQQQIESGEIGELSADPLCNCQDPTSVQIIEITAEVVEQDHATVLVTLSVSGIIEKLRINLVQEAQRWKIDDVAGNQIPSLRKSLIEN
ncbi:DUF3828 domain-containing protein [Limnobacter sp. P1]|jgi:hypothetical protein|uniref:DUF3828 domain-containing protein n=1 Tax=Limnobacter olei TaxID=3031298 RepID=UPI0023B1963E|nr:DUF3828 domain-containing protein [Limnobacter sp. P1]